MDITNQQADRAIAALEQYAITRGVTVEELRVQRVAVSDSLSKHIARVEQVLRGSYRSLSVALQNLLEECRAVAAALAPRFDVWEWSGLDRIVWNVAKGAM